MANTKVRKTTNHTAIGDSFRHAGHKLDEFGEVAGKKTDNLIHRGQDVTSEYTKTLSKNVKQHPVKSLLIAGCVGAVIGMLIKK